MDDSFERRIAGRVRAWSIRVERRAETSGSVLIFGRRQHQPVVLKVIRDRRDEWRSGEILAAFGGRGVVRALDFVGGAVLLERLSPGTSLTVLVIEGKDDDATRVLADVMARMSPDVPANGTVATAEDWGQAFDDYRARGGRRIPTRLLDHAQDVYLHLCRSQSERRLLHGDLHHDNVLMDGSHGAVAIDPKGVIGEREYEVGAALRNPRERPDLFTEPSTIARRIDRFARQLTLDPQRILAWAFAQAVLAAIWADEDGTPVTADHPWIVLAQNLHSIMERAASVSETTPP